MILISQSKTARNKLIQSCTQDMQTTSRRWGACRIIRFQWTGTSRRDLRKCQMIWTWMLNSHQVSWVRRLIANRHGTPNGARKARSIAHPWDTVSEGEFNFHRGSWKRLWRSSHSLRLKMFVKLRLNWLEWKRGLLIQHLSDTHTLSHIHWCKVNEKDLVE